MNILDIRKVFEIEGDKLDLVFEGQKRLKAKYDPIEKKKGIYVPMLPMDVNCCLNQEYLKSLFYRIVTELVEASECLKSKPWKQSEVLVDKDHLFEELSDCFHFFLELCICLEITSEKLFQLYFKKHEVNSWRIETNY